MQRSVNEACYEIRLNTSRLILCERSWGLSFGWLAARRARAARQLFSGPNDLCSLRMPSRGRPRSGCSGIRIHACHQQVGRTVAPRRLREHRVLRFVRQHGLDGLVAHHIVLQAFGVAVSLQVFEVGERLGEREAELVVGEVL